MIVVVAARSDAGAPVLAARRPRARARVLTAADLASPGWRVRPGDPDGSRAVVSGDIVPIRRITGVLTRLPAITGRELPMVAEEDRAYAATEMTAFLSYWLSSLDCPILNGPTPSCLCAPGWRTEQWVLTAARIGMPVQARHRHTPPFGSGEPTATPPTRPGTADGDLVSATVIGDRVLGTSDEVVAGRARALARAAGVDLLVTVFRGTGERAVFVDAHPWADVLDERTGVAVLDHLVACAGGARP